MPAALNSLTLGIMTKFWEPGRVKTRLGAAIGMRRAAALHRLFVTHLCEQLATTGQRRVVCLDPAEHLAEFDKELSSRGLVEPWRCLDQGTGSLGSRMRRWFESTLTDHPNSSAILIGGDCPTLGASQIEEAHRLLQSNQVALGPAFDGGYVLIGIRGPWHSGSEGYERLFRDIPWSTDRVMKTTRERSRQAGWATAELQTMSDIDTKEDLDRLREGLKQKDSNGLRDQIERVLIDPALTEAIP